MDFSAARHLRTSEAFQRLVEIVAQILDILNADGDAHERIVDPKLLAALGRNGGVSHDAWVLDEAFNAAKGLGEREEFDPFQHRFRRIEPAFEEDGDHAAKGVHLSARHLMVRMALETRIVDARYGRMRLKPFGESERVRGVAFNA